MAPGEARDSAMLTVHGRMIGYFEFLKTDDAIYCHYEASLKDRFPAELERYIFATRVEIADVSEEFALVLVAGDVAAPNSALEHPTTALGVPARYLWVPVAEKEALLSGLEDAGLERLDEAELEAQRIAKGAPRWGFEMDEKTFPQEAGIDAHAVHFEKGCYLGQEAMAKIHFRGKVNRRLARLSGEGLHQGLELDSEGKKTGVVTSVANGVGLGLIRYDVAAGSVLTGDDRPIQVLS
jgi:folate-binding protein YgfZ